MSTLGVVLLSVLGTLNVGYLIHKFRLDLETQNILKANVDVLDTNYGILEQLRDQQEAALSQEDEVGKIGL